MRLLIADDHSLIRNALARLLAVEEDIEIVGEASDGAMAVEMFDRCAPDVVLMDYQMPRMKGDEATRRIRTIAPDARIICFSMHDSTAPNRMLEAGANAFVSKAADREELIATIRETARSSAAGEVACSRS